MQKTMSRRGPDQNGIFIEDNAALVHARLAVVDIENGRQPMSAPLLDIVRKDALEALLRSDNAVPWYGQLMTAPQTIAYFLQLNYWLGRYKVRFEL